MIPPRLVTVGAAALLAFAGHSLPRLGSEPPLVRSRLHVSIPPQSLATTAAMAARIVHGIVADVRTAADGNHGVVTMVQVQVLDCLKGDSDRTLSVCHAGGRHGNHQVEVQAAPKLQRGDEVVLFLTNSGDDEIHGILGLSQGTLQVRRHTDTPKVHGNLAAADESLDAFLDRVRSSLLDPPAVFQAPRQEGK